MDGYVPERLRSQNVPEIVSRAQFVDLWAYEDASGMCMYVGFDFVRSPRPLLAANSIVVELDPETDRIDGFRVIDYQDWLPRQPLWVRQLWEARGDTDEGRDAVTQLFLNLACMALPELEPAIIADWQGQPLTADAERVLRIGDLYMPRLATLWAVAPGNERVAVTVPDPVTLDRDGQLRARLSVTEGAAQLRGCWGELLCAGSRLMRFPVTGTTIDIAAVGLAPGDLQRVIAAWPLGQERIRVPVSSLAINFYDAGLPAHALPPLPVLSGAEGTYTIELVRLRSVSHRVREASAPEFVERELVHALASDPGEEIVLEGVTIGRLTFVPSHNSGVVIRFSWVMPVALTLQVNPGNGAPLGYSVDFPEAMLHEIRPADIGADNVRSGSIEVKYHVS